VIPEQMEPPELLEQPEQHQQYPDQWDRAEQLEQPEQRASRFYRVVERPISKIQDIFLLVHLQVIQSPQLVYPCQLQVH